MYSLVLMMALSDSAALPGAMIEEPVTVKRAGAQELNRGRRRGGCCGCCGGSYGGCYGGGCYGGCYGGGYGGCYGGMVTAPPADGGATPPPPPPPAEKGPPPAKKNMKEEAGTAPATLYVSLPGDARLTVDDVATTSTSANRVFSTPALEEGKDYYYTLKAQVTRNGKVLTASQRVTVRAGQVSRVTLDVPTASGVASSK